MRIGISIGRRLQFTSCHFGLLYSCSIDELTNDLAFCFISAVHIGRKDVVLITIIVDYLTQIRSYCCIFLIIVLHHFLVCFSDNLLLIFVSHSIRYLNSFHYMLVNIVKSGRSKGVVTVATAIYCYILR